MIDQFFIPLINEKKTNKFTSIINFTETYFNFGIHCSKVVYIKANGTIVATGSKLPKDSWVHTVLKIVSIVFSFGLFPLAMLIIKFLYRAYHPLYLIKPLSASSFENQPTAILHKIFTEFFPPSSWLQQTVLNKRFDAMINDDFMKWESSYKKMTEGCSKSELDLFIQRVKVSYTHGKEPSFKQKVKYLCQELWEDAKQIPDLQKIIQDEDLTVGHLTKKKQYDRFKALIQPIKDANLIRLIQKIELNVLLDDENFKRGNEQQKANLIRDWLSLDSRDLELTKIKEINLKNSISLLSSEMLSIMVRMPDLQALELGMNAFSTLPEAIGSLNQLKILNLSDNQLSSLPKAICRLSQLQELYLARNQFSIFPEGIKNLSQLQILSLGHNQLADLPKTISHLNQLQELHLSHNKFSVFPEAIGGLNQLQILNLSGNQLPALPESIGSLSQLQELDLFNNLLSTLPKAMGNLIQLQKLHLGYNQFPTFPKAIGSLSQLQILSLGHNPLEVSRKAIHERLPRTVIV